MAWSLNRWFDSTLRVEYLRATNLYNFHKKWPSAFSYQGRELGAYSGRDSRVGVVDWQMSPSAPLNLMRLALFVQEVSHYSRTHGSIEGAPLVSYEPSYESSEWRVGSVFEVGFIDPVLTLNWGAAIGVE